MAAHYAMAYFFMTIHSRTVLKLLISTTISSFFFIEIGITLCVILVSFVPIISILTIIDDVVFIDTVASALTLGNTLVHALSAIVLRTLICLLLYTLVDRLVNAHKGSFCYALVLKVCVSLSCPV